MKLEHPVGATPLDPDSLKDLIPKITTQSELNDFEAKNIGLAIEWAIKNAKLKKNLLSIDSTKRLHKKMFDKTWRWAGKFRRVDTNLGVPSMSVQTELQKLFGDTLYWIGHETYSWDEIGARFHHRLVSIHPFPNGNGRHARLMTNLLLANHEQVPFTWGSKSLTAQGEFRKIYIEALQSADRGDFGPLIVFVRS